MIPLAQRIELERFHSGLTAAGGAGSIFPLIMYTPANQFLGRAKHNQIFSVEIARHITKLFCGVATVFMQENPVITFIHTFAANPFY